MIDALESIRSELAQEDAKAQRNRDAFPGVAQIIDEVRAVFGGGVKVLHAIENGRTIGKKQLFEGTDVDKIIRLDDAMKRRGTA